MAIDLNNNSSRQFKSKAICVLGMHRSGTSAIARAMNLIGAYIGSSESIMPPKENNNPEGFWEHISIVNFHEKLLNHFNRHWDSIFPLPDKWWKEPHLADYKQELIELISDEFLNKPLWMWKDPRTCLFLPIWEEVCKDLGIEVCYLVAFRNPLDVAASLNRRDGFSKQKCYALWLLYNLSSLYWTNESKRIVLSYDQFLQNWDKTLKNIASAFDIVWPSDEDSFNKSISSFLRMDLRHSHSTEEMLLEQRDIPQQVISLYNLFIKAQASAGFLSTEIFNDVINSMHEEYIKYANMFSSNCEFSIEHSNSIQVYWEVDNNYIENSSLINSIVDNDNFNRYEFNLPLDIEGALRIDPIDAPAFLEIEKIELLANNKFTEDSLLLKTWSAANGFEDLIPGQGILEMDKKEVYAFISTGNDPQIILQNICLDDSCRDNNIILRVVMHKKKNNDNLSIFVFDNLSKKISGIEQAKVLFHQELIELRRKVDENSSVIRRQRERLDNQFTEIENINALLVDKDKIISNQMQNINAQLIDKDKVISKQIQNINELNEIVSTNKDKMEQLLFMRAQVSLIEKQLNALHNSLSWKITLPLRIMGRLAKNCWELLKRKKYRPELLPVNDLSTSDGDSKYKWVSLGNDPQFILKKPYPIGWVRLNIILAAEKNLLSRSRLYVNHGDGFNETKSYDLGEIAETKILSKFIQLNNIVTEIRFDPLECAGSFDVKELILTRVSFIEIKSRNIFHSLRRKINSSKSFCLFGFSSAHSWIRERKRLPYPGELLVLIRKARYIWNSNFNLNNELSLNPPHGFTIPIALEPYAAWLEVNNWNQRREKILIEKIKNISTPPLFSIVMPVYNPPLKYLEKAIESIVGQVYGNWELCIADDASTDQEVRVVLEKWSAQDKRILVVYRDVNGNISEASNTAATLARGDFLVLLDQDDELSPDALGEAALYIAHHSDTDVLYSDDDKMDMEGRRFAPQFKPDWSPELLLSYMYFSHLFIIRRSLFAMIGGFRKGFEGSQDYDLALRITEHARHIGHMPKILYHWRVMPGSTASSGVAKPNSIEAGRRAVDEALNRRNIMASVVQPGWAKSANCGIYEHKFPDDGPSVTILIPTRNQKKILQRCLDSLSKTTYKNYQIIIIDNDSDDPDTIDYLKKVSCKIVRVPNVDGKFNYANINNKAVEIVQTDYVLFLNNDTEIISPNWLSQMVGYMGIEGVGAVGAKLLFPDGRIQHAGIVHGLYNGMAGPAFKLLPGWDNGYLSYANVTRNYLAVTAACLLTRRDLFVKLGGFDESNFAVAFNDVDYCYRLNNTGYRVVYCSTAELLHYEGYTRGFGDNPEEIFSFRLKYGKMKDPYYNPNLSLINERFEIASRAIAYDENPPIKALMCAFTLNWEGAPYSQYEMTVQLKEKGILDPIVYCHMDGPLRQAYEEKGVHVYVFEHPLSGVTTVTEYDAAIAQFSEKVKNWEVELVYGNTLQTFYGIDASTQLNLPSIWNPRESEPWQTYFNNYGHDIAARALNCFLYPYQVVFVANATRSGCEALATHHNAMTIHNGLNLNRLSKMASMWPRDEARKQLSIQKDEIMLLLLGTVCERKGQLDLLEAINILPEEMLPNIRCFIVGDRPGAYSDELKREHTKKSKSIKSRIEIIPETSDTALYYSAADIFICTSRIESFPRVILEAMAYNLPIITTPVFGISEQVKENVNALLYQPGDIKMLSESIICLVNNADKRLAMAKNSGFVLNTLNDFEDMVNAYGLVFQEAWLSGGSRKCVE